MVKNSTFCRQKGPWSQNEAQSFCRGKRFNQCTLKLKNKPAWCACVTHSSTKIASMDVQNHNFTFPLEHWAGSSSGSPSPQWQPTPKPPRAAGKHCRASAGACPRGCCAGHANGAGSSAHCWARGAAIPGSHQGTGCSMGLSVPADSSGTVAGMAGLPCSRHLEQGTRLCSLSTTQGSGPVLCQGIEHTHKICSSSFSTALMLPAWELGEEGQHTQTQIYTK